MYSYEDRIRAVELYMKLGKVQSQVKQIPKSSDLDETGIPCTVSQRALSR